jgi:hypothetical protein
MERDSAYTPAILKAAQASLNLGRSSEALALAQTVLARDPRNPEALSIANQVSKPPQNSPVKTLTPSAPREQLLAEKGPTVSTRERWSDECGGILS